MHLSYFNLEYLSHLIFILIPLWRGFYFSEDMLSDVHVNPRMRTTSIPIICEGISGRRSHPKKISDFRPNTYNIP